MSIELQAAAVYGSLDRLNVEPALNQQRLDALRAELYRRGWGHPTYMHVGSWGWGQHPEHARRLWRLIGASGGGVPDSLVVWIVCGGSTDLMPALEPIIEVADYMDGLRAKRRWF